MTGANRADAHVTGANLDRDFRVDRWEDLVEIRDGDRCPLDGGELEVGRSIVVGHIYQLGTKYSAPLEATFQDEDGTDKPYLMGSYGIGITRILAALVEQHHDEHGIVWPKHMAPFQVAVILANADDEAGARRGRAHLRGVARSRGSRPCSTTATSAPGVKFADADLIGYPVQVTVGKRGLAEGSVDLKLRATGERSKRNARTRGRDSTSARPARDRPLRSARRSSARASPGRSRRSWLYSLGYRSWQTCVRRWARAHLLVRRGGSSGGCGSAAQTRRRGRRARAVRRDPRS